MADQPKQCCYCGKKRPTGAGKFCCQRYADACDAALKSHEEVREKRAHYGTRLALGFAMLDGQQI